MEAPPPWPGGCGGVADGALGGAATLQVHTAKRGLAVRTSRDHKIVLAWCTICESETVFVDGRLVFPAASEAPKAVANMPDEILADFEEARQIFSKSPRGAAALLRLAIEKLCPILGAKKANINKMIKQLMEEDKISPMLQKALDTVRVIGGEAVHPGKMDLSDDHATAAILFELVNVIVERGIVEPNRIDGIYASLPATKLAAIAKRDGSTVEGQGAAAPDGGAEN